MKLKDLLISKIKVLYDVEQQLVEALPTMAAESTDQELKKGFKEHLEETKNHVLRLEEIFKILEKEPEKLESEGIRGIIKDGEWVIANVEPKSAKDSNLVRAAQYAEHYEIAGYTSAIEWARALGEDDIVDLLTETLDEEEEANEKLSTVGAILDKEII